MNVFLTTRFPRDTIPNRVSIEFAITSIQERERERERESVRVKEREEERERESERERERI